MKTMKVNIELVEAAAIAFALGARPVRPAANPPALTELPVRPPTPAWVWGFSPMLPWGPLKEGL